MPLSHLEHFLVQADDIEATKDGKKTGEVRQDWKILGYYPGLRSALACLPDHLALDPQITSLEDLMRRWDDLSEGLLKR